MSVMSDYLNKRGNIYDKDRKLVAADVTLEQAQRMSEVFVNSESDEATAIMASGLTTPQRVWLLHLNYSVVSVFGSEASALRGADEYMRLHDGTWERTSHKVHQWFNRESKNYVEVAVFDVQGSVNG